MSDVDPPMNNIKSGEKCAARSVQGELCPFGERGMCAIPPAPAGKESRACLPLTPAARTCRAPSGPAPSQLRVKRQPGRTPLPRSPNSGWSQVPYVLQKACGTSVCLGLRFSVRSESSSLFEGIALMRFKVFFVVYFWEGKGGGEDNVIRWCHLHPRQMMSRSG